MFKKIKFNLSVDGISINTFEQLQDNFSSDLLNYIENNKLSKWFSVRDMDEKAQQVSAIDSNASSMEQMKALCRVLELEDDEDVIAYLLEEKEKHWKNLAVKQEQDVVSASSTEESHDSGDTEASDHIHKGEDWSGRDLSGRDFTGADLRGYNLSGADFSGSNLTDANLSGSDLSKSNLTGAILVNADFTYCNFREANIADIPPYKNSKGIMGAYPVIGVLSRFNLHSNKPLELPSGVKGPDFTNSILDKALLSGNFVNANFTNVHAHEVNGAKARFVDATMKDANLSFYDLDAIDDEIVAKISFMDATMKNADFSFSTLYASEISEEYKKDAKFLGVKWI